MKDNLYLRSKYYDTLSGYGSSISQIEKYFTEILTAYSEPYRAYHNLAHIEYMFKLLDKHSFREEQNPVLNLAIFYHDIVYNPGATNNEEASAMLFNERAIQLLMPYNHTEQVKSLILSTAKHITDGDFTTSLLIDLDLAILSDDENYDQYATNIRKEYSQYDDNTYLSGRQKILTNMLKKEKIYATRYFHEKLETKARENMQRELALLKSHDPK